MIFGMSILLYITVIIYKFLVWFGVFGRILKLNDHNYLSDILLKFETTLLYINKYAHTLKT